MSDRTLRCQAAELEQLLPKLMRTLFALDPAHPVMQLSLAQLRVCTILQWEARPISALAEELNISVSAATQIADRLEKICLVERVAEPEDRRMRSLQLTAQGDALMRSRRETRVEHVMRALSRLSPEERERTLDALNKLLYAGESVLPEVKDDLLLATRMEQ